MHRLSGVSYNPQAQPAHPAALRNRGANRSQGGGCVIGMDHRQECVGTSAEVETRAAQGFDLVLGPQSGPRRYLIFPASDPGGLSGQRQEILAMLQVRVQSGKSQGILTRA